MKRHAIIISTVAWLTAAAAMTSFAQPPVPPAPQDPNIPAAPAPGVVPGAATSTDAQTGGATITVSRTFTNAPGAITIVGTAASEQEKQTIGAKLQEAAPGRMINNQLMVSGQGIFEPSGAERSKGQSSNKHDDSDSRPDDGSISPDKK